MLDRPSVYCDCTETLTPVASLESSGKLTCVSLYCEEAGVSTEHPLRRGKNMQTTQESGFKTRTFLLCGDSANHCAAK